MKIHLICLMALDLDWDILDHWIDHYKKLDIDVYTVFIDLKASKQHLDEGIKKLNNAGFRTCHIHTGTQYCEETRDAVMRAYCMAVPEHEFIISVDSDEFQMWPDSNIRHSMMNGEIDMMQGYLIDCLGNDLTEALPNIPLAVQYPKQMKHFERDFFTEDDKIYNMNQEKICCNINEIKIDYYGSHSITVMPEKKKGCFRARGTIDVLHYKWRATAKKRLLTKPWYNEEKANQLLNLFKEPESCQILKEA